MLFPACSPCPGAGNAHLRKPLFYWLISILTGCSLSAATTPVRGGDVAAGVIGGLAAGTIIGAAVAGPRYYAPRLPPPPVYVAPACYRTRGEPVWDGCQCVDVSGRQNLRVNRSDHSGYAPHPRHEPFPRTMRSSIGRAAKAVLNSPAGHFPPSWRRRISYKHRSQASKCGVAQTARPLPGRGKSGGSDERTSCATGGFRRQQSTRANCRVSGH